MHLKPSRVFTEFIVPEIKSFRLLLPAVFAVALGGCSTDWSSFSVAELNPLKGSDPLRAADYNYFYKRDQSSSSIVTAADLVGPDGRCAFDSAPSYAPAAPAAADAMAQTPAADPINPRSNQALYFTAGPESSAAAGAP